MQSQQKDKVEAKLKLNYDSQSKQWRMAKDEGMAKGPNDYPKLKVEKDHVGEFTFVIQNPKGVTFASTKPFSQKAGATNPSDFDDQFDVSAGGSDTLVVKDANANKNGGEYAGGDYVYQLQFSDGSTLDPIITNGGCCSSLQQSNVVYYSLGAVALVALVILLVRPMLGRR